MAEHEIGDMYPGYVSPFFQKGKMGTFLFFGCKTETSPFSRLDRGPTVLIYQLSCPTCDELSQDGPRLFGKTATAFCT